MCVSGLGTGLSKGPGFSVFRPTGSVSCRGSGSGAGRLPACPYLHTEPGAGYIGASGQGGQGHVLGTLTELLVCGLELSGLALPTQRSPHM